MERLKIFKDFLTEKKELDLEKTDSYIFGERFDPETTPIIPMNKDSIKEYEELAVLLEVVDQIDYDTLFFKLEMNSFVRELFFIFNNSYRKALYTRDTIKLMFETTEAEDTQIIEMLLMNLHRCKAVMEAVYTIIGDRGDLFEIFGTMGITMLLTKKIDYNNMLKEYKEKDPVKFENWNEYETEETEFEKQIELALATAEKNSDKWERRFKSYFWGEIRNIIQHEYNKIFEFVDPKATNK